MPIKEILSQKIKLAQQHPFLFIGSGFSKRYIKTESWEDLLRKFCLEIDDDEFRFNYYANECSNESYIEKMPQIATLLEKDYNRLALSDDRFSSFREAHKSELKKNISPLKIAISDYLKETVSSAELKTEEIDLLRKLSVRNISGIITTNYDQLVENIFSDYKVFIGQEELIFSDIFQIGEIYKIHGCVTKPESIVLTSQDYKKFEDSSAYLIAKILTIFLEYPIIFIGYSIQDKNILDIFEAISSCLSQNKLDILKDRFIFIEYSEDIDDVSTYSKSFSNGNIISMTKITTNDFASIYEAILENKAKYNPKILRKLRHDIYKLAAVDKAEKSKIVAIGFENIDKLPDDEFVIGLGISDLGYKRIKAENIYEDIVLDNKFYDPCKIISETLPELLPQNSSGLPVFKYLKSYDKDIYEDIKKYVLNHTDIDSFLNSALKRQKAHFDRSNTVKSILSNPEFRRPYEQICLLDKEKSNLSDLETYLAELLKSEKNILKGNTSLKRLIRIYDWLKYKNTPDSLI